MTTNVKKVALVRIVPKLVNVKMVELAIISVVIANVNLDGEDENAIVVIKIK